LNIPVMHDDQHGTAIISGAALLNALELVDKKIDEVRIIVNGAGASAVSCTKIYMSLGAKKENIFMYDSRGLIHGDRDNLNGKKPEFINNSVPADTSLTDILKGADVFIGLSKGNILSKDMVKGMAPDPIIFAMANPTPEISYNDAKEARPDCIMATGRSDYPNQVNNVLGFPYIFRGALDVRASTITEAMKLAAVRALADLAKQQVPDIVNMAYGNANLAFGRDYIIPKPVDPRLITTVAPAVAKAAMDEGDARHPITDWEAYNYELSQRLGLDNTLTKVIETRARQQRKKVVFADAENVSVLKAAAQALDEGIAEPILLGTHDKINEMIIEQNINLNGVRIIDPKVPNNEAEAQRQQDYADTFYEKRKRKGVNLLEAKSIMTSRSYYGAMMVEMGDADAMIGGLTKKYPATVRPALQVIGARPGVKKVAAMHIVMTRFGPLFLADTSINHHLDAEDIAGITELVAEQVRNFDMEPSIAMVTYSSFGGVPNGESAVLMREATKILHERHPNLKVDGEMQVHMAMNPQLRQQYFPFSKLGNTRANTLIFPNLSSANIAYNLLGSAAEQDVIGPILLGMNKPVHILQLGSTVRQIFEMVGIAAVHAQSSKK
ncbi:MAG: phosphate acyltransferase, partial [Bacteroidota bacterium]